MTRLTAHELELYSIAVDFAEGAKRMVLQKMLDAYTEQAAEIERQETTCNVLAETCGDQRPEWYPPSEMPEDGASIWIEVLEWDGVNKHLDYAQTFSDVDGLRIHRYEGEKGGDYSEAWPPSDVMYWTYCLIPFGPASRSEAETTEDKNDERMPTP